MGILAAKSSSVYCVVRFGFPSGLHQFIDVVCYTFFVQFVGTLGKDELAATGLAFNLNTLVFIPLIGIGTAVMTLTGQRIGEGRPGIAVATTWKAFLLSTGYVTAFACFYLGLPDLILWPYWSADNQEEFTRLASQVVLLLRFVALYSLFDAMAIIFGFAIRGAGDTRFAMLFSLFTGVFFLLIPTRLSLHYGYGLHGAWGAVTLFIAVVGIGFLLRFQLGPWKTMPRDRANPGRIKPSSDGQNLDPLASRVAVGGISPILSIKCLVSFYA